MSHPKHRSRAEKLRMRIEALSSTKIAEQLINTEFESVMDVIKKFNINGKDLLELSELQIRLLLGADIDRATVRHLQRFVHTVQNAPESVLQHHHPQHGQNKPKPAERKLLLIPSPKIIPSAPEMEELQHEFSMLSSSPSKYENPPAIPKSKYFYIDDVDDTNLYTEISEEQEAQKVEEDEEEDDGGYLRPVEAKPSGRNLIKEHHLYRDVGRTEGIKMLQHTEKGTFLLRPSSEPHFLAILMINGYRKVQNLPIWYNRYSCLFYLDTSQSVGPPMTFKSIDELLRFYAEQGVNGDKLLPIDDCKLNEVMDL